MAIMVLSIVTIIQWDQLSMLNIMVIVVMVIGMIFDHCCNSIDTMVVQTIVATWY